MKLDPNFAPPGYRAVEWKNRKSHACEICAFKSKKNCLTKDQPCSSYERPDGKEVYFVRLDPDLDTGLDPDPATVGMGERSFAEWPVTEK